jgi:hypothetical protein
MALVNDMSKNRFSSAFALSILGCWLATHAAFAVQRMELAFLGALPGNQRTLVTEGQPVITAIELRVVGEEQKPSRG